MNFPFIARFNLLAHLSFDWQAPDLPETFKSSFFYKEAVKKAIGHKALEPGIRAEDLECNAQVRLFEYQSTPSQTENVVRGPVKRDFNEKNINASRIQSSVLQFYQE